MNTTKFGTLKLYSHYKATGEPVAGWIGWRQNADGSIVWVPHVE